MSLLQKISAPLLGLLLALALSAAAHAAPVAYITNQFSNNVSVIDTASNSVVATVPVGSTPFGVAVTPDGAFVYVANRDSNNVSVIASASNSVVATVPVGSGPVGVAVTPDGAFVYVANRDSNNVSVIASATNSVVATVGAGSGPRAFGKFIVPAATVFPFSGFFRPVDNLPTVNTVKAGSAIPVKFSLGGDRGLAIFAPSYPKSQQVQCASAAPFNAPEVAVTAGNSGLSYDSASATYTYVWKTNKAWSGTCRQLTVRLSDGSDHSAQFVFR